MESEHIKTPPSPLHTLPSQEKSGQSTACVRHLSKRFSVVETKEDPNRTKYRASARGFPFLFSIDLCTGTGKQDTVANLWEELRAADMKAT